jgi:hypothetical protein
MKSLRGKVFKFHPRKAVVPSGAIRDQRIPALEAPTFGDAAALEHHMRDALRAKMLAHRNPPMPSGTTHPRVCAIVEQSLKA